ncbi:MAG: hypothetical protein SPE38_09150 [Prevotella sp.]|nr:hypothetical protein [Bacteroidales bacterium]MDY4433221.1 hypothetical protein [Prevotella sp.]
MCALHDRRQRERRREERRKGRRKGRERREEKERERKGRGRERKKRRERIYLDMKCQNVVYSHNRAKNAVSVVIFVHIVSQIRQKFLKFLVISVIICTFVTV